MRRIDMCCLVGALATSLPLTPAIVRAQRDAPPPPAVWLESGPELAPGQPAQLGYDVPRTGYLTILRANTNGDLSVVYPERPNGRSNLIAGAAIPIRGDAAPGVGYLFWVTSPTPFDFRQYAARGGAWSAGGFAGRGDPFEQVDRFARGTTRGRYSVGYSSYRVGVGARGGERGPAIHDGGYPGDGYAGYGNAGYGNTGYGNTGYGNTGYGNTGYGNTGYGNTGYGNTGYGNGAYDGYSGWWGGPQWNGYGSDTWRYRRSWRDQEYQRAYDRAAHSDPRSRYLRHCPDGTLAPYTVPCGAIEPDARTGHGGRSGGRPQHD